MQVATTISDDNGMIVKRLSVPIGLEELMESLTKQVLLKKPRDIYAFASEHFAHLLTLRDKTMKDGGVPQSPSNSEKDARNALKSIKVKSHTVATKFNKLPTPIIFTNSNTKRQTTPITNTKRNTKKNTDSSPRLVDRSLTTSSSSSHKSNKTEPANQGRVGRARWKKRDSSLKDQKLPISLPPKKPNGAKVAIPVSRPKKNEKNEDKGKGRPISNKSSDDQSDTKKEAMKRRSKSIDATKKKPTLSQSSSVDESILVKGASISLNNKNRTRKSKSPLKSVVAPVAAVAGVAAATLNNKKRGDVAINNEINLEKSDKQDLMESIKSDVDSSLAEISDSILIKDDLKVEIKDDAGDSDFVDEDDKESFVIEEGGIENEDVRERLETITETAVPKQDIANMADVIEEKTELKELEEVSNALIQEDIINMEELETKIEDTLIEDKVAEITEELETKIEDTLIEDKVAEITEAAEIIEQAELKTTLEDTLMLDKVPEVAKIAEAIENVEQAVLEDALIEDKVAEVAETIESIEQDALERKLVEVTEDISPTENIGADELENKVTENAGILEAEDHIENGIADVLIQATEDDDADPVEIVELVDNETVEDRAGEDNGEAKVVGIVETDDEIVAQINDTNSEVEIVELETDTNNENTENIIDTIIEDNVNLEVTHAEDAADKNKAEDMTNLNVEQEPKHIDPSPSDETEIKEVSQEAVLSEIEKQIENEVIVEEEVNKDIADTLEEGAPEEKFQNLKLEESINATVDETQKNEEQIIDAIEAQEENKLEDQSANLKADQTLSNVSDETIKDILLSDAKANEIIEQDEKIKDVLLENMEGVEDSHSDIHNLTSRFLSLEKENYDTNKMSTEGQTAFEEREIIEKTVVPIEMIAETSNPSEVVELESETNNEENKQGSSILETISKKMSDVKAFFTPGSREKENDDAPGYVHNNTEENLEASNNEDKTETIIDTDEIMKKDSTAAENIEDENILKIEEIIPVEAENKTTAETKEILLEAVDDVKLENDNTVGEENKDLDSIIVLEGPADEEVLSEQLNAKLPNQLHDSNNSESVVIEDVISLKDTDNSTTKSSVDAEEETSGLELKTTIKEELNKIEADASSGNEEKVDLKIAENNDTIIEDFTTITDEANASKVELEKKIEEKAVPITEMEVAKSGIKVYDDLIIETTSDGAEILNLEQQITNDDKTEEIEINEEDKNDLKDTDKIAEEAGKLQEVIILNEEKDLGEISKEDISETIASIDVDGKKSPVEERVEDVQSKEEYAILSNMKDLSNKLAEDESKNSTEIADDIVIKDGSIKVEEIIEANVDINSDIQSNLSETNNTIDQSGDRHNTNKTTNVSEVQNNNDKTMDTLENNQEITSDLKDQDEQMEKGHEHVEAKSDVNDEVIDKKHDLLEEDEDKGTTVEETQGLDTIDNKDSKEEIVELHDNIVANNLESDRAISPKLSNESILNLDELQIEDENNILTENLHSHIEDEGPLQLEALTQYLMSQNNSHDSENENETSNTDKDKKVCLDDDKELEALSQYLMNKPDTDKVIDDKDKTDTPGKAVLEPDDDTDNQVDSLTNSTSSTNNNNNNNNNNDWESKEIFGQSVKPNEPVVEALKLFPQHQAATKIQSVWRGHNTRKMAVPQQLSGDLSSISDDAVTAATVIQAFVRGHLVRKQLSKDNLIGNKIRKLEPFVEESGEIEDALIKLNEIKVPDEEPDIEIIDNDKKDISDKVSESNEEKSEKSEENDTYTVASDGKDISVEDNTYVINQDDPKQNEKNITEKTDPEDVIVGNLNFIMQGDSQENADIPSTKETKLGATADAITSSGPSTEGIDLSDNSNKDSPQILENQLNIQIGARGNFSTDEDTLDNDKISVNSIEENHDDKQNIHNDDDKLKNNKEINDSIVSDNILEGKDNVVSEDATESSLVKPDGSNDVRNKTENNDTDKLELLSDELTTNNEQLSESIQLSSLDSNIKTDSMKNSKEEIDDLNKIDSALIANLGKDVYTAKRDVEEGSKTDENLHKPKDNEEAIDANISDDNSGENSVKDQKSIVQDDDQKTPNEINQKSKDDDAINNKDDDLESQVLGSSSSEVQNNVIETDISKPEDTTEQNHNLEPIAFTDNKVKEASPVQEETKKINKTEDVLEKDNKTDIETEEPLKQNSIANNTEDSTENADLTSDLDNLNSESTTAQIGEEKEDIYDTLSNVNNEETETNITKENEANKIKKESDELTGDKDNSKSKDDTEPLEKDDMHNDSLSSIKGDTINEDGSHGELDESKEEVDGSNKHKLDKLQVETEKDHEGNSHVKKNEDTSLNVQVEEINTIHEQTEENTEIKDEAKNSDLSQNETAQAEYENGGLEVQIAEEHQSEEGNISKEFEKSKEESKSNQNDNKTAGNDKNETKETPKGRRKRDLSSIVNENENSMSDESNGQNEFEDPNVTTDEKDIHNQPLDLQSDDLKIDADKIANQSKDDSTITETKENIVNIDEETDGVKIEDGKEIPDTDSPNSAKLKENMEELDNKMVNNNLIETNEVQNEETMDQNMDVEQENLKNKTDEINKLHDDEETNGLKIEDDKEIPDKDSTNSGQSKENIEELDNKMVNNNLIETNKVQNEETMDQNVDLQNLKEKTHESDKLDEGNNQIVSKKVPDEEIGQKQEMDDKHENLNEETQEMHHKDEAQKDEIEIKQVDNQEKDNKIENLNEENKELQIQDESEAHKEEMELKREAKHEMEYKPEISNDEKKETQNQEEDQTRKEEIEVKQLDKQDDQNLNEEKQEMQHKDEEQEHKGGIQIEQVDNEEIENLNEGNKKIHNQDESQVHKEEDVKRAMEDKPEISNEEKKETQKQEEDEIHNEEIEVKQVAKQEMDNKPENLNEEKKEMKEQAEEQSHKEEVVSQENLNEQNKEIHNRDESPTHKDDIELKKEAKHEMEDKPEILNQEMKEVQNQDEDEAHKEEIKIEQVDKQENKLDNLSDEQKDMPNQEEENSDEVLNGKDEVIESTNANVEINSSNIASKDEEETQISAQNDKSDITNEGNCEVDKTHEDELLKDSVEPSDENLVDCSESKKSSTIKGEKVDNSENIKEDLTETDNKDKVSNKGEEDDEIVKENVDGNSVDAPKNTADNEANTATNVDNKESDDIKIDVRGNFEDGAITADEHDKEDVINEVLNEKKDVKDVGSNHGNVQNEDITIASSLQETTSKGQAENGLIEERRSEDGGTDSSTGEKSDLKEDSSQAEKTTDVENANNLGQSSVDNASITEILANTAAITNTVDKDVDKENQKSDDKQINDIFQDVVEKIAETSKVNLENPPTTDSLENHGVESEKIIGKQNASNPENDSKEPSLEIQAQVDNSNIVNNKDDKNEDKTNQENAQDAQEDKAQNPQNNIEDIDKIEQNKNEAIPLHENSTNSIKDSDKVAKEFKLGASKDNLTTSDADMYSQDSMQTNDGEMSNDFTSIETNDDDHETKDILAQIKNDLNHMRNLITNKDEDEAPENSEVNDNKEDHLHNVDNSNAHSPIVRLISTGSTTSLDSSATADRDNHFDRLVSTGSTTSLDSAATVLLTEDLNKWRAKNDFNEDNKQDVEHQKEESNKDKEDSTNNENIDNLKDLNKTKAPKIGSELAKSVSIEEAAMRIQNFFKCYMANKHDENGKVEEEGVEPIQDHKEESNLNEKTVEDINKKNVKQRPTLGQFIRSLADSTSPPPDLSLDLQRQKTPSPNNLNANNGKSISGDNLQRINSPSLNDSVKSKDANLEAKVEPIKSVDTEKPEPFYLHEPDKITENPISAAIRASSQLTNQEPSIGLLHSGEFHDSIPLNYTPTNLQVIVQNNRAPSRIATPSPPGLLHSGELHDALIPRFRDAAAGAAPVTVAQASDKDGQARSESETDKEDVSRESVSKLEFSDMDGKRNNAAIAEKNTESEAATKIQASFRGYQVRKQLKTTGGGDITSPRRSGRRKSSGRVIDSNKNPPKKDKGELEERSATKIQAGIRGFLVRRRQKNKNESP